MIVRNWLSGYNSNPCRDVVAAGATGAIPCIVAGGDFLFKGGGPLLASSLNMDHRVN